MAPAFVSVREAAQMIGICRELVRQEVRAGRLTGFKQGTKLMVSRASIDAWIAERDTATPYDHRNRPMVLPTLPRRGGNDRGVRALRATVAMLKAGTTDTQKAR